MTSFVLALNLSCRNWCKHWVIVIACRSSLVGIETLEIVIWSSAPRMATSVCVLFILASWQNKVSYWLRIRLIELSCVFPLGVVSEQIFLRMLHVVVRRSWLQLIHELELPVALQKFKLGHIYFLFRDFRRVWNNFGLAFTLSKLVHFLQISSPPLLILFDHFM